MRCIPESYEDSLHLSAWRNPRADNWTMTLTDSTLVQVRLNGLSWNTLFGHIMLLHGFCMDYLFIYSRWFIQNLWSFQSFQGQVPHYDLWRILSYSMCVLSAWVLLSFPSTKDLFLGMPIYWQQPTYKTKCFWRI